METDEAMVGDQCSNTLIQATRDGVLVKNLNTFTCMVCNITVTGIIPAESHLLGAKHKKAVQMPKLDAAIGKPCDSEETFTSNDVVAAIRSGQVLLKHLGNTVILVCVPCCKTCSGEVPMRQHLTGETHAKRVRLETFASSISSQKEEPLPAASNMSASFPKSVPPEDGHSVQDGMLSKAMDDGIVKLCEYDASHLHCVVCDVNCTGKDSMKEHLVGKNHLKMQKAKELLPVSSMESITKHTSEIRVSNFPLDSATTISISESVGVIAPPPQFEDSAGPSSSATEKENVENGTNSKDNISSACSRKPLSLRNKTKMSLNQLKKVLPDVRVYSSSDKLTDLFDG